MADVESTKPVKEATHPKYSEMIATAIETLKERGGSSRVAIIKFITNKYKVSDNPNIVNSRLKLALKKGVESGALTQVKGTGASGSFKLAKKAAKKPKKAVKSPKAAKKSPKKLTTKKPKAIKSPKNIVKSTKTTKSPKKAKATKPPKAAKSPKAKKVAAKKPKTVKTPKKATASKNTSKPKSKKTVAEKTTKKAKKPTKK